MEIKTIIGKKINNMNSVLLRQRVHVDDLSSKNMLNKLDAWLEQYDLEQRERDLKERQFKRKKTKRNLAKSRSAPKSSKGSTWRRKVNQCLWARGEKQTISWSMTQDANSWIPRLHGFSVVKG